MNFDPFTNNKVVQKYELISYCKFGDIEYPVGYATIQYSKHNLR